MIEARSENLKRVLSNETVKNLIEKINQDANPQLREEAYKIIMEQTDILMGLNGGEGPKKGSEDGALLEVLAETVEAYESGKFKL
ncbi:hypothetical protein ACFL12_01190 [Pseudomonadota bacterium]